MTYAILHFCAPGYSLEDLEGSDLHNAISCLVNCDPTFLQILLKEEIKKTDLICLDM